MRTDGLGPVHELRYTDMRRCSVNVVRKGFKMHFAFIENLLQ